MTRREHPAHDKEALMTIPSLSSSIRRRLWVSGLAFALVAAIVGSIRLTSSPSPADATMAQTASALNSALAAETTAADGDRATLRADLKAARKLDGKARVDALEKIRADAKAGKYGPKVKKLADRRGDHKAAFFALLPDELQADLKALKAAPPADRKKMREAIHAKALAGGYGDKVKRAAELLKGKPF